MEQCLNYRTNMATFFLRKKTTLLNETYVVSAQLAVSMVVWMAPLDPLAQKRYWLQNKLTGKNLNE
jgi:hypothetical protein